MLRFLKFIPANQSKKFHLCPKNKEIKSLTGVIISIYNNVNCTCQEKYYSLSYLTNKKYDSQIMFQAFLKILLRTRGRTDTPQIYVATLNKIIYQCGFETD